MFEQLEELRRDDVAASEPGRILISQRETRLDELKVRVQKTVDTARRVRWIERIESRYQIWCQVDPFTRWIAPALEFADDLQHLKKPFGRVGALRAVPASQVGAFGPQSLGRDGGARLVAHDLVQGLEPFTNRQPANELNLDNKSCLRAGIFLDEWRERIFKRPLLQATTVHEQ